jgi:flagellar assembly factor FliW
MPANESHPMYNANTEILTAETLREKVIRFPNGIPGFPASREFIMTQKPEERPFAWLQSVSDPDLVFAVVDAYSWVKDFMLEVDDAELEEMGSIDPMDYAVYFILRIEHQDSETTLKAKPNAPVLVNTRTRKAKQVIASINSSLEDAEALCLHV